MHKNYNFEQNITILSDIYVCMHVCMFICVCINIYVYTYTHIYSFIALKDIHSCLA